MIDRKPRYLSEIEFKFLRELGKLAENELAKEGQDLSMELSGEAEAKFFLSLMEYVLNFSREMKYPMTMLVLHLPKMMNSGALAEVKHRDQMLLEVSRLFANSVRSTDVIGRFAEDSFYVFLPKCNSTDVELVLERMKGHMASLREKMNLSSHYQLEARKFEWKPESQDSVDDLIVRGEQLLKEIAA